MTAAFAVQSRIGSIDRLRGAAILLMVLDHALVFIDGDSLLRVTATRWSLPLFMVASAACWKGFPRRGRVLVLAGGFLAELALSTYGLGLGTPGPVALLLGVLVALWAFPVLAARPGVTAVAGLLQALYLPVGWSGYQPGLVLAYYAVGLALGGDFAALGRRMPGWLEPVGRFPMRWYVGHLAVLNVALAAGLL